MKGARRPAAALALILTAAFMVVLDFSIVNVALAAIERELHVGGTEVQWVITAYAVTFGGLLVLGGRLGDLIGRRRLFIAGLVVFSAASLAGGLAGSLAALVAARAVQGIGAAVVAPTALSLVTTSIAEGPARTRALGLYGATASVGFVAGLVLGGILVQLFDWRAVLFVNVPIGVAAAVLAPLLLPAVPAPRRRERLDVGGALLVTAALAAAVSGISNGPAVGWGAPVTLGTLAGALAGLVAFVAVERRHPRPLVRLGLFRLASLRTANLVSAFLGAWSAAEVLVMPLYFQLVLHRSALLTGLALAPQGIAGFLGSARGAGLLRRLGVHRYLALSATAAASGLVVLGAGVATRSYPVLLAGILLAGYGTGTGAFGSTVAATQGVAHGEQGVASGLVNMSRQVGAALGVAVAAGLIGTDMNAGASLSSDRLALFAAAIPALAAALVAARQMALPRSHGTFPDASSSPTYRRRALRSSPSVVDRAGRRQRASGHPADTFTVAERSAP